MKTFPTPKEIVKLLGETNEDRIISVQNGDSIAVRTHEDKPVVAYGIGANIAVFVVKTKIKSCAAYQFSFLRPLSSYKYGSASEISLQQALETIKTYKHFYARGINKKELVEIYKLERPVVASFDYTEEEYSLHEYCRIVRLKSSGKLRAESGRTYDKGDTTIPTFRHDSLGNFMADYLDAIGEEKRNKGYGYRERTYHNINVPEEIREEINRQMVADAI